MAGGAISYAWAVWVDGYEWNSKEALTALALGAAGGFVGGALANVLVKGRAAWMDPSGWAKVGSALGSLGAGIATSNIFPPIKYLPSIQIGATAHSPDVFAVPSAGISPLPRSAPLLPSPRLYYDIPYMASTEGYSPRYYFSESMQNCAAIDVAEGIAGLWNCLSKDDAQPLPDQLPVFAYRQTEKFFGTASQNYKNLVKRMNDNWDKCGDATKRCAAIIANAKELSKPAQDAVVQACREISENSCRLPLSSFGGKTEDLCSCLNDAILKASEAIDKIANANASKAAEIQKAANALGDKSTAELTRLKAEAEKRNEEIAARDKKIRELEEARLQKDKDKDNPALQQQQRDAQMERQRHQDQLASLKDASERQLKGVQDAAERRQQELAGRMQDVKEQARDARTGAGGGSGRGNGGGAEGDASRATQAAMQEMRQQQEQERMRQQQREDQERMRQQQQDMQRQQMAAQQDRAKEQQARLAQQNASAAQRSPGAAPGAVPSQQAAATNAAKSAASQTVSADPRQDRPPTQPAAVPNPNAGDDLAVVFPDGRVVQVVSTTVKYGLLQELDKKVNNAEAAYQGSPVVMPGTQIGPSELITGCVAKSTTTSLLVVATGSPTSGEPLLAVLDGGLVEFNPDSPRLKELGTDWKFWRPDKIADAMPVNQQAVPVDTTPDLVS